MMLTFYYTISTPYYKEINFLMIDESWLTNKNLYTGPSLEDSKASATQIGAN
jgi:hypothetical protein